MLWIKTVLSTPLTYNADVVDVSAAIEQQLDDVDVVALCGHVQRRQRFLGLGRHGRTALNQRHSGIVLAAASCHVQRRQAVLQSAASSVKATLWVRTVLSILLVH